jgi:negative regulator of sigma E activity
MEKVLIMTTSTQSASTQQQSRPWWREPWPWILMAGPAAAIVACIITIVLAVQNFSDQAITDGGLKRGLVVSKPGVSTPDTTQNN